LEKAFYQGGIVITFRRWQIFVSCLFAFAAISGNTVAQGKKLSGLFKTAPSVWQNDSLQTSLRPRLHFNDRWQITCKKPQLSGEIALPGAFSFEGEVDFQSSFRLDSTLINRPLRLVMQGAHYDAQVRINNDLIGSHQGGYTSFASNLRPERLFFDKENLLQITVSNMLSPLQTLPPKQRPYGWLNEGGIGREIYLEALPEIFIERTKLNYSIDPQTVAVNLEVELNSQKKLTPEETAGISASLEIWDARRLKKLAASTFIPIIGNDRFQQTLTLNCQLNRPNLWSPIAPNLYTLRVALLRQNNVFDESWEFLGFRKIEFIDGQLHLNGEPFVLRGVNWIEDYGNNSALLDTTRLSKILSEVKALGANTIRVVGHPPHSLLPTLCDRAGIFLLEELPLYYLTEAHFRQPQFFDLAQLQAHEMISRDLTHPSVLAWGVAVNSDISMPEARSIVTNLCQMLRQYDARPIYAVTPLNWFDNWEPLVDLLLPDLFENENVEDIRAAISRSRKPVLPIIGFWMWNENESPGEATASANARAEQRQAEKLNEVFKKFDDTPKLAGYFIQALTDWPAAMPSLVLGPNAGGAFVTPADTDTTPKHIFIHPAGMIGGNGQRRMAFQLAQAFNRGDRRQMLLASSASQVFPQEYPIVGLAVVLVLLFYLNRDRRLRGNLQRMFVHPHGFYVDINENRKVPPFLSALLGLTESCIIALLLSGFCYANRTSLVFDQYLNLLIDDPAWKARVVWLIWHPSWFIIIITAGLFVVGLITALFMRILGFFLGRSLPTIQYFTFVFWTACNLLVLGIIAPFFYRMLLYKDFAAPLLFLVIAIFLWLAGRLFRGMRVVYAMSIPRTMIILGILVGGLIISLVLYYQRTEAIFEYGKYYWRMLQAGM
jgi:hypothetical protein